jgi:NAD(P)-dependent dehydrogenase (short-subunit alcohol dehydrogenase family)
MSAPPLEARIGLTDRTVWVVGAGGGGIGTAVAAELVGAGAHVVGLDRDPEALEATEAACTGATGRFEGQVLDATDRAAMESFVSARRAEGKLASGLVNIVGGLGRDQFGSIQTTPDETFDAVLRLNLRPAWLSSQLWAGACIASGRPGSLVQLASIAALQGMPFGAPYALAKAALISLARTQALEWGPHGIRVNTVAAGTIRTPRATSSDDERDRRVLPLGRRGTPRDIAGGVLFLLSDLAEWVTGQVLAVDGGVSVKPAYLGDDGLPVFVEDADLRERLFEQDGGA